MTRRNRNRPARTIRAPRPALCEILESRLLLTVTIDPLAAIYGSTITLPAGKAIQVPITATNTLSGNLTYTVTSSNPSLAPVVNVLHPAVSAARTFIQMSTSMGNMIFELFNDIAPQTVTYLLTHLTSPDYTNSIFQRIIQQNLPTQTLSIVQGGDRNGDGIDDNPGLALEQELDPRVLYTGHGQLAEARTSQPDTGGSQFFVTVQNQRFLDFNYTIYGQLVRGWDVLTALNSLPTDSNDRPLNPPTLNSITVVNDPTDAVITLVSNSGTPLNGTITVTAKDAFGNQNVRVFNVATVVDTTDDPPFLAPPSVVNRAIPENTGSGTPTIIDFGAAVDLESSAYTISGAALTSGFSGNIPDSTHLSILPNTGFTGLIQLTVTATQNNNSNITSGRTYSFFVDSGAAPTATLHATDLFASAGQSATFTITYADDTLLDSTTLTSNSAVTVYGPGGAPINATFVSVDNNTQAATHTVTYRMTAPGGNWDTPDAGSYYVAINAGVIKDTLGNAMPLTVTGFFCYSPTAFFDERYYLAMNPDIAAAVANHQFASGYAHFIAQGQTEGRAATPFFSEHFYDTLYPDVAAAIANHTLKSGWQHFVLAGQFEGRYSNPAYDEATYLRLNPDVAAAVHAGLFTSGLEHFILAGQYENRTSSLFFDITTYMANNPDVVAAIAAGTGGLARSVVEHFLITGQHEGRTANVYFNETYYLATYPDVAAAVKAHTFASGFEHFELSGAHELRNPSTLFNSAFYLSSNPDVAAAVANKSLPSGFYHFMLSGKTEGRLPAPGLQLDLETVSGGKTATVHQVGDTVTLNVYARILGADAITTNDGIQESVYSIVSSPSGLHGNLGTPAGITIPDQFQANAFQTGTQVDLNGDGDLDVGSTDSTSATGWIADRADSEVLNTAGSTKILLGTLTYTVTSVSANGKATVNVVSRTKATALLEPSIWQVDGSPGLVPTIGGTVPVGLPVTISVV